MRVQPKSDYRTALLNLIEAATINGDLTFWGVLGNWEELACTPLLPASIALPTGVPHIVLQAGTYSNGVFRALYRHICRVDLAMPAEIHDLSQQGIGGEELLFYKLDRYEKFFEPNPYGWDILNAPSNWIEPLGMPTGEGITHHVGRKANKGRSHFYGVIGNSRSGEELFGGVSRDWQFQGLGRLSGVCGHAWGGQTIRRYLISGLTRKATACG